MLLVVQMFRMAWTPFALTQAKQPGAPQLFSRVLTALMPGCSGVFLAVTLFLPVMVRIPAVYGFPRTPAYWLGLSELAWISGRRALARGGFPRPAGGENRAIGASASVRPSPG